MTQVPYRFHIVRLEDPENHQYIGVFAPSSAQTTHGPVSATPGTPPAVTLGAIGASSAPALAPLLVGLGLALAAAGLVLRCRASR